MIHRLGRPARLVLESVWTATEVVAQPMFGVSALSPGLAITDTDIR
jgi:hypothetical protein